MNAISNEKNNHLTVAEKYYEYMLNNNFDAMTECLHPDVIFISPLDEMTGREAIVSAAKKFTQILENIEIRFKLSNGNQIMLVYDFILPDPINRLRSAGLMEFKNGQISKIELFYDGRPFDKDNIRN